MLAILEIIEINIKTLFIFCKEHIYAFCRHHAQNVFFLESNERFHEVNLCSWACHCCFNYGPSNDLRIFVKVFGHLPFIGSKACFEHNKHITSTRVQVVTALLGRM